MLHTGALVMGWGPQCTLPPGMGWDGGPVHTSPWDGMGWGPSAHFPWTASSSLSTASLQLLTWQLDPLS